MTEYHPDASAEIPRFSDYPEHQQDHDSWQESDYIQLQSEAPPMPSYDSDPTDYPVLEEDTSFRIVPWLYLFAFLLILYWIGLYIKRYYNNYLMKLENL
jgi:hypothetical protein